MVFAYLLIICAAFYIVSASLTRMVGEHLFSQKVREEQRITDDAATAMASALLAMDADALYRGVAALSAEYGGQVMVLDLYGVVQADQTSAYNGRRLAISEIAQVLGGARTAYGYYNIARGDAFWTSMREHSDVGGDLLGIYAARISAGDQMIGVLAYVTDAQALYESLNQIRNQMALWLVLMAIAVMILAALISRVFTKPIQELSQGISRMAAGDLSSRVVVRGHNEFSELAAAFNSMCEKLERLDKSRSLFVSNASHELKTPLSSIKLMAQILMMMDPYDPDILHEYSSSIDQEVDRLNEIVGDLLTLVHADSERGALMIGRVRLDELVQKDVDRLQLIAERNKITVETDIRDRIEMAADGRKLDQVFYNLLVNAIRYTPPGGHVRAEVARDGRNAVVRVIDNGIGIPEADIPMIFERFYRVDKARSRATGGTGLGLAIVKEHVAQHGGTVTVESKEDVGSVFTITLPIVTLDNR